MTKLIELFYTQYAKVALTTSILSLGIGRLRSEPPKLAEDVPYRYICREIWQRPNKDRSHGLIEPALQFS